MPLRYPFLVAFNMERGARRAENESPPGPQFDRDRVLSAALCDAQAFPRESAPLSELRNG
jgi:hypothetical protein